MTIDQNKLLALKLDILNLHPEEHKEEIQLIKEFIKIGEELNAYFSNPESFTDKDERRMRSKMNEISKHFNIS
jgi:hypothetical protein